jgi:hypothetical protein
MKQNPNSSNSIPDFAAKKGKILETLQQRKKPKEMRDDQSKRRRPIFE